MSTATAGLAEAYVMRKIHKENMKKMEKTQAAAGGAAHKTKKSSGGFFSGVFKKVHPSTGAVLSSDQSAVRS